jgi:hypothetical protein
MVKVNHPEEFPKSSERRWLREVTDSADLVFQWSYSTGGDAMSEEVKFRSPKDALRRVYDHAMVAESL